MRSVRRWYIFLVATISLHALVWALIALLRNLLRVWGEPPVGALAFQIAVIVIGLPVFLIHWLWAQRLAADPEERAAPLRCLYLYGNMAALLAPALGSAYDLCRGLLGALLVPDGGWGGYELFGAERPVLQGALGSLIPLVVLGLLWLYHRQVATADAASVPPSDSAALIRRLSALGFSLIGLVMVAQSATAILRWVLYQLGGAAAGNAGLIGPVAGLLVGLPLWLIAWELAQRRFRGPDPAERESVLRKFYLHAVVFFSALAAVSAATLMLAGLLRGLLGLPPAGDIRGPLPLAIVAAVIWAYHSLALRRDAAAIAEAPRQAAVRRLSWYLVASIGLAAALIGLGLIVNLLIRAVGAPGFGDDLREQLAWGLASIAAGLPVWALIWRRAEGAATADGPAGEAERTSLVRRIYLYAFLFAATLTVLGGLIYIVSRLLSVLLGEPAGGDLLTDLAQAIAFSLIAAGVLLYHGAILRREGRRRDSAETARAAELRVAVLDLADGALGRALLERLRRELPGLAVSPIGLTPAAAAAMGAPADEASLAARLAGAGLIVGPWQLALPRAAGAEVAEAVAASPARKLLLPAPAEGWDWAGVEPWNAEAAVGQAVLAVRQTLSGEPIRPARPLSPLALAGTVVGVIVLLLVVLAVAGVILSFV